MDTLSSIKKQLAPLRGDKRVVAVILFGSRARGEARPLSDVDICILAQEGIPIGKLLDLTPSVDADVSYFNNLPISMRQKVISEGKIIINKDPRALAKMTLRTISAYLDFNPLRERMLRAIVSKGVF